MIYILCVNPSIDCYERHDEINIGKTNRTNKQELVVGGKGINLAYMFKNLDVKTKLITVLGGFTGKYAYDKLINDKIDVIPVWSRRNTRINFKITSKEETAFDVNFNKSDFIISKLKEIIKSISSNDTLIVSGSGYGYEEILNNFKGKLILDVNGQELKKLIQFKPFLIKPNKEELIEFLGNDNIEESLLSLKKHTKYLLCTLGSDGSILVGDNICIKQESIEGDIVTTVGCGDVFLATYLGLIENGYNLEESFKMANMAAFLKAKSNKIPSKKCLLKYFSL